MIAAESSKTLTARRLQSDAIKRAVAKLRVRHFGALHASEKTELSAMPVFSPGRDAIFTQKHKIALHVDGFPDFYALLGTPRDASMSELETAITSRAADLLAASFSRGGKGEFLVLLQQHVTDLRPVLLDKVARLAYDEQLRRHENGEARALPFGEWRQTFATQNRLSRGLQNVSRGFTARLKSMIWDAEFL